MKACIIYVAIIYYPPTDPHRPAELLLEYCYQLMFSAAPVDKVFALPMRETSKSYLLNSDFFNHLLCSSL